MCFMILFMIQCNEALQKKREKENERPTSHLSSDSTWPGRLDAVITPSTCLVFHLHTPPPVTVPLHPTPGYYPHTVHTVITRFPRSGSLSIDVIPGFHTESSMYRNLTPLSPLTDAHSLSPSLLCWENLRHTLKHAGFPVIQLSTEPEDVSSTPPPSAHRLLCTWRTRTKPVSFTSVRLI